VMTLSCVYFALPPPPSLRGFGLVSSPEPLALPFRPLPIIDSLPPPQFAAGVFKCRFTLGLVFYTVKRDLTPAGSVGLSSPPSLRSNHPFSSFAQIIFLGEKCPCLL